MSRTWQATSEVVGLVALLACASAQPRPAGEPGRPTLVLSASRYAAFPSVPILLTAKLEGGEDSESMYCPRVVWAWADGTESAEEDDCPAFDKREEYQRRWTRWVGLAMPGVYHISVRLEKAGRVLAEKDITLVGMGGEQ